MKEEATATRNPTLNHICIECGESTKKGSTNYWSHSNAVHGKPCFDNIRGTEAQSKGYADWSHWNGCSTPDCSTCDDILERREWLRRFSDANNPS